MNEKRARQAYRRLNARARSGARGEAEAGLAQLLAQRKLPAAVAAQAHNDLGVLLAAREQIEAAREHFVQALAADATHAAAQENLARLPATPTPAEVAPAELVPSAIPPPALPVEPAPIAGRRIALVSLLFSWPARGGGCMHTVGLGQALQAEGYAVRHFYARHPGLGVGKMEASYPLRGDAVECAAGDSREQILTRFRGAVEAFSPEAVVITDAWNFKPHLARAFSGVPVLLRFDGQECLCPLNNCRYLSGPEGTFSSCPSHQLAAPDRCRQCLATRGHLSGPLHQMERALSEVEQPGYQDALRQALWEAAAVLVNNPLIAEMLGPYAPRLHVIPPGIDAGRFPWEDDGGPDRAQGEPVRVFMAGAIEEPFKGFAVLHEACARLWQERQDFRLSVTADTPGTIAEWGESTGWLSQEELPQHYREADICIVPSLVQEAWANTASEAMAAGRSLIASRTGGLQFMVAEEATGLLFTPGDVEELVGCLRRLLDDRELRRQLGRQGRQRFLRTCSWEALMAHHYRPLLQRMLAEAGAPPLATPAAQEVA